MRKKINSNVIGRAARADDAGAHWHIRGQRVRADQHLAVSRRCRSPTRAA